MIELVNILTKDVQRPVHSMRQLYGDDAVSVLEQCLDADIEFGRYVNHFIYGILWACPLLKLAEKSLITIVGLNTLGRSKQLEIHLRGWRHLGEAGDPRDLTKTTNSRYKALAKLASAIALGHKEQTKAVLRQTITEQSLSLSDIYISAMHLMVYLGCPCAMNTFAVLQELGYQEPPEIRATLFPDLKEAPTLSAAMTRLYGSKATAVYDRCETLSPSFNYYVQRFVYDVLWQRSGLTDVEKSLVTITTLTLLNKEEQLNIHLTGWQALGQTISQLTALLNINDIPLSDQLQISETHGQTIDPTLSKLVAFTKLAIADDQDRIRTFLKDAEISVEQAQAALYQMMTYTGCPIVMNGLRTTQRLSHIE